jgi:hypothetical protein
VVENEECLKKLLRGGWSSHYYFVIQVRNYIMSDPEKKQKLFYNRAQHQLREIEFSCREVVTLSQNIKIMGGDISDADINCKKIEFIKTEIKEKLKEVASNIDEIYKILDRKIVILTKELRN